MTDLLRRLRSRLTGNASGPREPRPGREPGRKGPHNLFEAAATHVAACAEGDEDRGAEAADWVSPEALAFGINELACRALIALARERRQSPHEVARDLLSLPAA
ncbi:MULTISPECIES: hypothetical protein [Streptomyces]|uniref:ANTAR domain-containing protein n=1 Tax=Streptomyces olivaceiscleroticus TaxID=68245 RepID=A0ABN1BBB1_9ACTN|nr:hypothetical protein [Streptomyces niger]